MYTVHVIQVTCARCHAYYTVRCHVLHLWSVNTCTCVCTHLHPAAFARFAFAVSARRPQLHSNWTCQQRWRDVQLECIEREGGRGRVRKRSRREIERATFTMLLSCHMVCSESPVMGATYLLAVVRLCPPSLYSTVHCRSSTHCQLTTDTTAWDRGQKCHAPQSAQRCMGIAARSSHADIPPRRSRVQLEHGPASRSTADKFRKKL